MAIPENPALLDLPPHWDTQDADGDEWRPVRQYEDLYAVSNRGHVRRIAPAKSRRGIITLKPRLESNGNYLEVSLWCGGKKRTTRVHVLVAEAFLGARPPGLTVNHKDRNKLNNHVSNLEWVSQSENQLHAWRVGTRKPPVMPANRKVPDTRGSKHHNAKLTEEQAKQIKYSDEPALALATRYHVSPPTVRDIRRGHTWRHI